jgi:hypothetical protein
MCRPLKDCRSYISFSHVVCVDFAKRMVMAWRDVLFDGCFELDVYPLRLV